MGLDNNCVETKQITELQPGRCEGKPAARHSFLPPNSELQEGTGPFLYKDGYFDVSLGRSVAECFLIRSISCVCNF